MISIPTLIIALVVDVIYNIFVGIRCNKIERRLKELEYVKIKFLNNNWNDLK